MSVSSIDLLPFKKESINAREEIKKEIWKEIWDKAEANQHKKNHWGISQWIHKAMVLS